MARIRSAFHIARLSAITAVLYFAARQPIDAAGLVKIIGTRTRTNVINDSIAVVAPTTGVAAGNSVIISVHVGSLAAGGAISCFDAHNGAYTVDVVSPAAGAAAIAIVSRHNIAPLTFGELITCNYPSFNGASSMSAYEFTGILSGGNPLDQTAQSASSSAGAISSGLTATTSQAGELVFGFVWLGSALQSFVPATSGGSPVENPYNPPWSTPFAVGTQKTMFRLVSPVGQYEANGTVTGAGGWFAQVATYRLTPDLCLNVNCDDALPCTADSCDPATGSCLHSPLPAGTSCGDSSSGICDNPDRCDGAGVCLTNHVADGIPCGEVNSDCDLPDTCLAGSCHDNGVKPQGTLCGDSSASQCDGPDTCNAFGACLPNNAPDGSPCGDAESACVNADSCAAGFCDDYGFKPAGTACGDPSSSACDNADSCNATGFCLVNHVADGTACGDAEGACVNADACAAGSCHDNGFKVAGTACGDSSTGACDNADSCNAAGSCLVNHSADGTPCGDTEGACVNADSCASGACQDNGFKAIGTACGDPSASDCDTPDTCDAAGSCLPNHLPEGTACGDLSASQCDATDTCNVSGVCLPNLAASGTPCNDGDACTAADACDGSGGCAGAPDPICNACDGNGAPILDPIVTALPADPIPIVSGLVMVTATFSDAPGQTHACTIVWDDGTAPDSGVVSEPVGSTPGSCAGSHVYTAVGVYTVSISVADSCGESAGTVYKYAVVYDPTAGFVTGGGWIVSPVGAYTPNPALTGKAHFGFVAAYAKGNSTVPTGQTEFQYNVANFSFSSNTYEWFVVSGAKARFRGTGTVNGGGRFGFALTAWDGESPGGGGIDRFRIRIWDQNQGDAVVYDNQIVCPNQGENADPCTALGGGSIVFHKK
jgi:hypothetical protein